MSVRKLFSLSLALALVYSISLPARAELLKNFKTDGSIEVKSFGIDNEFDFKGTHDDYRSETRTRVLVGGSFDLLDDVHARVLLRKNNRVYNGGSENAQNVQDNVWFDNAYTKIDKLFGHVDLTMGRQFYGSSDDLLIYFGVLPDDLLSVTALDIFRADADVNGWAKIQAIAGKIADNGANSSAANVNSDTDVWGLEVNTDKLIPKGTAGLGYYTQQTKKAAAGLNGTDNNTLNNVVLKANGDIIAGLGYAAEYVQNFGRNAGFDPVTPPSSDANRGSAYIIGLKENHDFGNMPLRAHAEYGRGSRDFQSIAAGKRFGIIWGEHTIPGVGPSTFNGVGGAGLTNLKVFDFGAGTNCPITHIGIDLNWYRFIYDDGLTVGTPNGNTSAGSELDLILSYKHSENVSLELSAARFWVGDANQNTGNSQTSPITRLGGDVKIKF